MCFPSAPPGKPPCLSPVRPLDKGESLAMNANAEQPAQYIEKHGIWIKKKPQTTKNQTTKNQTKQTPPKPPALRCSPTAGRRCAPWSGTGEVLGGI